VRCSSPLQHETHPQKQLQHACEPCTVTKVCISKETATSVRAMWAEKLGLAEKVSSLHLVFVFF
jgi:hypothetical protein